MSQISANTLPSTRVAGTTRISWSRWAIAVAAGAVLAAAANTLVRVIAVAAIDVHDEFEPLAASAPAMSSVVAAIGAGLVLAVIVRFSKQPVRSFVIVSAVVFVLSYIPLLQMGLADPPEYPGTTGGTLAVLGLMHVVAAVIVVPLLAVLPFSGPDEG
jgi:hypothetical protein